MSSTDGVILALGGLGVVYAMIVVPVYGTLVVASARYRTGVVLDLFL